MIGGYIYREIDPDLDARLRGQLDAAWTVIDVSGDGYLFHDEPFGGQSTSHLESGELVALTQDLLVTQGPDGEYRPFDLRSDLSGRLAGEEGAAFDSIASDYRLAAIRRRGDGKSLFLVSNRAGSGRIYYRMLPCGVIFSSDLRLLLRLARFDLNRLGLYSILKYGAVPEPMTICSDVNAVPPAHYLRYDVNSGERAHLPYFKLRFESDTRTGPDADESEFLPPVKQTLQRSSRFLKQYRPVIMLSGGIDSSLYGCYLSESDGDGMQGFYCQFGEEDPELEFAKQIADRTGSELHVARMSSSDALQALDAVVRLTDHPFSDFSSLPITFLLQYVKERVDEGAVLVECNGGDDCFGFPDLGSEQKYALKHRVPKTLKRVIAGALGRSAYWKWESRQGVLATACAVADVHERNPLDYFLVLTPVGYLRLKTRRAWDDALWGVLDRGFANGGENYDSLSFGAKTTIRQLLQVNSRRWAAKALSVGEGLGIRVIYPYIWREVLIEQGRVPWSAKIKDGVVKWPLKRLLEEYMPESFIYRGKSGFVPPFARWLTEERFNQRVREVLLDRDAVIAQVASSKVLDKLLSDALKGRKLRHAILNFLWAALFTEMWIQEHG
jgi:asparagine synthase (glutamine-hydrolysing)